MVVCGDSHLPELYMEMAQGMLSDTSDRYTPRMNTDEPNREPLGRQIDVKFVDVPKRFVASPKRLVATPKRLVASPKRTPDELFGVAERSSRIQKKTKSLSAIQLANKMFVGRSVRRRRGPPGFREEVGQALPGFLVQAWGPRGVGWSWGGPRLGRYAAARLRRPL